MNLQRIEKFFPQDPGVHNGYGFSLIIDRPRFDAVEAYLHSLGLQDSLVLQEFCFIILWIENYVGNFNDPHNYPERFRQMWQELDDLKEYLLKNRITAIRLEGEEERKKPGKDFIIREEINIDRICDSIRSAFREEFLTDRERRTSRGKKAWKSRKMVKVRNNIMNYLAHVPGMDSLSLEDQSGMIDKLSDWAGVS